MKTNLFSALTLVVVSTTSLVLAQECNWTGKAGDGQWSSAANWSDNTLPVKGSTVNLTDSGEVSSAGAGAHYFLPHGIALNLKGKTTFSNDQELVRLPATELTVFPGASVMAGHLVFYDAQCVFHDGATVQVGNWEQNGSNVFTFILGQAGFPGIFAKGVWFGDIKSTTYIADMAAYKGGEGVITLMEFKKNNGTAMSEEEFNGGAGLKVLNPGPFPGSKIRWNAQSKAIELVVAK